MATLAEQEERDQKQRLALRRKIARETTELVNRQMVDMLRAIRAISDEEWQAAQAEDQAHVP